jgi:beta-aspartyl-peptidase (threonine type)
MTEPRLIVHGGAWDIPDQYVDAHITGVRKAVEAVFPRMEEGLSALEAVEHAVNILESDPTFDAGRGAFLNSLGEIELDALIMDGATLDFGAVAAVKNLLHPVSLARKIMDEKDFRMLAGEGAQRFARTKGFTELQPETLLTERERKFFAQIKKDPEYRPIHSFSGSTPQDTVGAVALDKTGSLACATSTGGTPRKHPGRIGDSPIIGCGAYAENNLGAASSTGYGESIMKVILCKTACDRLEHESSMDAACKSIKILKQKGKGFGGIILLNSKGKYGFCHNTPRMAFAFAADTEVHAAIHM